MSSLTNALDMLRCLEDEKSRLRVTPLANQLGLPKSTVSRTLATLADYNFLERDKESRSYRIGVELYRLGHLYTSNNRLIQMMEDALHDLVREHSISGYVGVLHGYDVVHIRALHSASALRFTVDEGSALPAYVTAIGKALLARLAPERLSDHLPNELSYKPLGIKAVPRQVILNELEEIRDRGYATLRDEGHRNAGAIGIALAQNAGSEVAFAVNFPLGMLDDNALAALTETLLARAETIASNVGDTEWLSRFGKGA